MKFQDMETSNIRLRGKVIHLMKDVETIKINQDKQIPLIKEHISNFNKFKEQRSNMYKKKEKVYQKYEPEKDSNFSDKNRGFQAR